MLHLDLSANNSKRRHQHSKHAEFCFLAMSFQTDAFPVDRYLYKKNDKCRVADMSQSRHKGHDQDMNATKSLL